MILHYHLPTLQKCSCRLEHRHTRFGETLVADMAGSSLISAVL